MGGFFTPDGANAVQARPPDKAAALPQAWCRDTSHPGAGNGTRVTATLLNQIIANLRSVVTDLGGEADGSDVMLVNSMLAGLLSKSVYDPEGIAGDAFDMGNMAEAADAKILTAAERAKLGLVAVTGAVDLDEIAMRVTDLDAAVVLQGTWDPASGEFPGAGVAQAGWSWIVEADGTVDGVTFNANDRIIAIVDNASTGTYAGNWYKADYTDAVQSIEGQTGALTLAGIGAPSQAALDAVAALVNAGVGISNGEIVASADGSDNLVVALKNHAGNDPSVGDPVTVRFPDRSVITQTAALSLTITSGSTMGLGAAEYRRLWFVLVNDAGTLRIAARNCCLSDGAGTVDVEGFPSDGKLSATAEGGAGAADSAAVTYAGAAITSKPYVIAAFAEFSLASAGTWEDPDAVVQYGPGIPLPGQVVRERLVNSPSMASGSTQMPLDNTVPQSSEGVEFITLSHTPLAAGNVIALQVKGQFAPSIASHIGMALFRGTAAALCGTCRVFPNSENGGELQLFYMEFAASTSAITYSMRAGLNVAGIIRMNRAPGSPGSQLFGGRANSYIALREIMG